MSAKKNQVFLKNAGIKEENQWWQMHWSRGSQRNDPNNALVMAQALKHSQFGFQIDCFRSSIRILQLLWIHKMTVIDLNWTILPMHSWYTFFQYWKLSHISTSWWFLAYHHIYFLLVKFTSQNWYEACSMKLKGLGGLKK